MSKYSISFHVSGVFRVSVNADSLAEAQEKAEFEIENADFGYLCNIDWYAHHAEDENGNWTNLQEE